MSLPPFRKAVLLSLCASSSLFALMSLPLATLRSQSVQVQLQNETVFESELNTLSSSYLWAAGGFSVVLGGGLLAIGGWRAAVKRAESNQAKTTQLEEDLATSRAQLETLQFSEKRLQAQGLSPFLEDESASVAQSLPAYLRQPSTTVGSERALRTPQPIPSTPESTVLVGAIATPPQQGLGSGREKMLSPSSASVLEMVMQGFQNDTNRTPSVAAVSGLESAAAPNVQPLATVTPIHKKTVSLGNGSGSDDSMSPQQLEVMLNQLKDLANQVETLRRHAS